MRRWWFGAGVASSVAAGVVAGFGCGDLQASPPSDAGSDAEAGIDAGECTFDAGFAKPLGCPADSQVACASFDDQLLGDYSPQGVDGGLDYIDPPPCTPDHARGAKVVRVLPDTNGGRHPFLQRNFAANGGVVPGPNADVAVRFAMRIDGRVPSTPFAISAMHDASSNGVRLFVSKTQIQPQIQDAALLQGEPFTFEAGRWYCVELDARFVTAGSLHVSIDGQPVIADAGADLGGGDAGFAAGPQYIDVGVVTPYVGEGFTLYLDDLATAVGTTSIGCN